MGKILQGKSCGGRKIWYTEKAHSMKTKKKPAVPLCAGGGFIMFLEIIKAILMGIVEGITEWLPISSTGHMILLEQVVKFNASEEFMSMFRVVIQLGAIIAVVVLFWNKLWPFGGCGTAA